MKLLPSEFAVQILTLVALEPALQRVVIHKIVVPTTATVGLMVPGGDSVLLPELIPRLVVSGPIIHGLVPLLAQIAVMTKL